MNTVLTLFVVLLAAKTVAELLLFKLNRDELRKYSGEVPEAFRSFITQERYDKSVEYSMAKNWFDSWETIYDSVIISVIILSGFLPWLFGLFEGFLGTGLWDQALTLVLIAVVLSLPTLPLEWWSQFRLEEKFGFNRNTLGLWLSDKLKGTVLGIAIGVPVIWVLLSFFDLLPGTWWIWAFAFIFVFQVVMLILYPMVILPLFNKLKPLEEGDLKDRLMRLADKAGFHAKSIEVIDGSKRSTHSNAFFTGFGKFRRIVLFDTLIEQLSPEELEAVLAHEIGHYKRGHIPQRLVLSAVTLFGTFAAIAWLVHQGWFYESFGFEVGSGMVPALILFSLLGDLVTFWFTPLMNMWSRKHEYEADAFARDTIGGYPSMISSLRKLHEKNLSNLTPNKWFSRFYYSHPTLLEREAALKGEIYD